MNAPTLPAAPASRLDGWLPWVPVVLALLVLFVPTYLRLHESVWQLEAYEHGPIILAVFLWLLWRERAAFQIAPSPRLVEGTGLVLVGLVVYFVGRTQDIALLEVGAQVLLVVGVLLVMLGWATVRRLWFPLLFMLFLVPLPGFVIVGITAELKQHVSAVAETLLYHAGYPIARDGVVITIGQYRMLVADACSGLNSMYSLSALGLLYMYLARRPGWLHNGLMLLAILPIAFVANVVRVLLLILVTFHFGDEAGQGFLHNTSGMVLFLIALVGLFSLDWLLGKLIRPRPRPSSA